MKRLLLICVAIFATAATTATAQSQSPALPTLPEFSTLPPLDDLPAGGWMSADQYGFTIDGQSITIKQVKLYAAPYRDAMRHIRSGQVWQVGGYILAGIGGGFIGMEIGEAIFGDKITGAGIVLGLVIVGGGFGLELISISQFKKAAADYNSATGLTALPEREVSLALAATGGGVGLQLTF